MATFETYTSHITNKRRPLRVWLRLFWGRNAHYRAAGPFIYLGGAFGTAAYALLGLAPQIGLLVGTVMAYVTAAAIMAIEPCSEDKREDLAFTGPTNQPYKQEFLNTHACSNSSADRHLHHSPI